MKKPLICLLVLFLGLGIFAIANTDVSAIIATPSSSPKITPTPSLTPSPSPASCPSSTNAPCPSASPTASPSACASKTYECLDGVMENDFDCIGNKCVPKFITPWTECEKFTRFDSTSIPPKDEEVIWCHKPEATANLMVRCQKEISQAHDLTPKITFYVNFTSCSSSNVCNGRRTVNCSYLQWGIDPLAYTSLIDTYSMTSIKKIFEGAVDIGGMSHSLIQVRNYTFRCEVDGAIAKNLKTALSTCTVIGPNFCELGLTCMYYYKNNITNQPYNLDDYSYGACEEKKPAAAALNTDDDKPSFLASVRDISFMSVGILAVIFLIFVGFTLKKKDIIE